MTAWRVPSNTALTAPSVWSPTANSGTPMREGLRTKVNEREGSAGAGKGIALQQVKRNQQLIDTEYKNCNVDPVFISENTYFKRNKIVVLVNENNPSVSASWNEMLRGYKVLASVNGRRLPRIATQSRRLSH